MGAEEKIRIQGLSVSPAAVAPGSRFTVEVRFSGPGNIGIRQDIGSEGLIPGWDAHGEDHAFLPGRDFQPSADLKAPNHFHRDNGELDLDSRPGHWRAELDTTDWPEGTYALGVMVCNRPRLGPFEGQLKPFRITVGDPMPLVADEGDLDGITLAVNDVVLDGRHPEAPLTPGSANALRIEAQPSVFAKGPLRMEVTRTLPGSRTADDTLARQTAILTEDEAAAIFDLGAFAVPADFDFTGGRLRRRTTRYQLTVRHADGSLKGRLRLAQSIGRNVAREVLRAGEQEWVHHLGSRGGGPKPLDPPFLLSLHPDVLEDPDSVTVLLRLRKDLYTDAERETTSVPGVLSVITPGGQILWKTDVAASAQNAAVALPAAVTERAEPCRISFLPRVPGTEDRAGPSILYRPLRPAADRVRISPVAPWSLQRDASRVQVDLLDMERARREGSVVLPDGAGWVIEGEGPDSVVIHPDGARNGPAVEIRLPDLQGWYALFAEAHNGWGMLQVGDGLVRGFRDGPTFVEAADLGEAPIRLYPVYLPGTGLAGIRLVPVTEASVQAWRQQIANPPVLLRGVADWCDYFADPPVHHSGGGRLEADQLELLTAGHGELGMRSIAWSIGRSWVEYHSTLPSTTRFPCRPLSSIDEKYLKYYHGRSVMINEHRPLESAISYGEKHGVDILPWLSMQRHYGEAYGGIFASDWFRSNPQWHRVSKSGSVSPSTVCYHFEEVRQERCKIFAEVAEKGVRSVVVGCCRQVPMLLYHPDMVADFMREHDVDPRTIDASDTQRYDTWIRWRADRFTQTLRDLRQALAEVPREPQDPAARIVVRIPSVGLFYNLAQGLDVRTWLKEGLVDELQIEPLEDTAGAAGDHDLRPYLELADAAQVPVFGAVNGNTWHNLTAVLRRAQGLMAAGVAGIEIYESNNFAVSSDRRWLVPLLGQPDELDRWLNESNLDAVYPVWSRHAASGFDNHSFSGRWTVYGSGGNAL